MCNKLRFTVFLGFCILAEYGGPVCAQVQKDTARNSILNGRIARQIVESVTVGTRDTLLRKAEEAFLPYTGKIIRNIHIEQLGFERSFYNGKRKVGKKIVDIGNAMHGDTKLQVIRNNLFLRRNKPLNAYKVADNERYLRDLEFILDARITVQPVEGTDSVDLVVVTRDVFSLGGNVDPRSTREYEFGIYDANLGGWGQRLEYNGLIDYDREPVYGHEFIYTKNSISGSLIDGSVGYTSVNTGSSYGMENEQAAFLRLSRPLVSPYTRMAGGLEWSRNSSKNMFDKADSAFLKYTYHIYDVWAGYNIGVNNTMKNRSRHFVALRWFHQDFRLKPEQEFVADDPLYNDNSFVLAEFTLFRQDFYKTRYIYGFGRTEDVPYGYSASFSVGRARQLDLKRLYVGGGLSKKVVNKDGAFYELNARGATYVRNGEMEDITLLLSSSWFSQLLTYKKFRIRQLVKTSYAIEINPVVNELLRIGNEFGVRGFRTDSLRGRQRLGVTSETLVFTNWKLLGFHFAPLAFLDVALLPPPNRHLFYDAPYAGIGAGMRARNENLILGTIEGRFTYYPRVTENISRFNVNLSFNLRVKYTDSFVRAPAFLRFN